MSETKEFDEAAAAALAQLVDQVISDPSRRKLFGEDPGAAAAEAGIDISAIPERVVATLADLSDAELRLLTELNETLVGEGLGKEFAGVSMMVL